MSKEEIAVAATRKALEAVRSAPVRTLRSGNGAKLKEEAIRKAERAVAVAEINLTAVRARRPSGAAAPVSIAKKKRLSSRVDNVAASNPGGSPPQLSGGGAVDSKTAPIPGAASTLAARVDLADRPLPTSNEPGAKNQNPTPSAEPRVTATPAVAAKSSAVAPLVNRIQTPLDQTAPAQSNGAPSDDDDEEFSNADEVPRSQNPTLSAESRVTATPGIDPVVPSVYPLLPAVAAQSSAVAPLVDRVQTFLDRAEPTRSNGGAPSDDGDDAQPSGSGGSTPRSQSDHDDEEFFDAGGAPSDTLVTANATTRNIQVDAAVSDADRKKVAPSSVPVKPGQTIPHQSSSAGSSPADSKSAPARTESTFDSGVRTPNGLPGGDSTPASRVPAKPEDSNVRGDNPPGFGSRVFRAGKWLAGAALTTTTNAANASIRAGHAALAAGAGAGTALVTSTKSAISSALGKAQSVSAQTGPRRSSSVSSPLGVKPDSKGAPAAGPVRAPSATTGPAILPQSPPVAHPPAPSPDSFRVEKEKKDGDAQWKSKRVRALVLARHASDAANKVASLASSSDEQKDDARAKFDHLQAILEAEERDRTSAASGNSSSPPAVATAPALGFLRRLFSGGAGTAETKNAARGAAPQSVSSAPSVQDANGVSTDDPEAQLNAEYKHIEEKAEAEADEYSGSMSDHILVQAHLHFLPLRRAIIREVYGRGPAFEAIPESELQRVTPARAVPLQSTRSREIHVGYAEALKLATAWHNLAEILRDEFFLKDPETRWSDWIYEVSKVFARNYHLSADDMLEVLRYLFLLNLEDAEKLGQICMDTIGDVFLAHGQIVELAKEATPLFFRVHKGMVEIDMSHPVGGFRTTNSELKYYIGRGTDDQIARYTSVRGRFIAHRVEEMQLSAPAPKRAAAPQQAYAPKPAPIVQPPPPPPAKAQPSATSVPAGVSQIKPTTTLKQVRVVGPQSEEPAVKPGFLSNLVDRMRRYNKESGPMKPSDYMKKVKKVKRSARRRGA